MKDRLCTCTDVCSGIHMEYSMRRVKLSLVRLLTGLARSTDFVFIDG